jgi:hypothetical protein
MIYNALLSSAEDLGETGRVNDYENGLVSDLAAFKNALTSSFITAPPGRTPTGSPGQAPISNPISDPNKTTLTPGTNCVEATLNSRTDLFPLETFVDMHSGVVLW